ncbi:MAG: cupin domain-containing protein [Lautropia sp.]
MTTPTISPSNEPAPAQTRLETDVEFDEAVGAWFGNSRRIPLEQMKRNVFRFDQLPGSPMAFIDAALPGHQRTLMGALGAGAADENLRSMVEDAQHYHIDFIRAMPGNGAALHSHDTEETFICLTGRWKVTFGDVGEHAVELGLLDGIVCPSGIMRSFENIGDGESLLLSILGGRHPGHVVWAQSIRQKMRDAHGAR